MKKKGLFEMLGATFIWGSTPIMSIYSHLPGGVFVFFRVLFAFPFIFYFALKHASFREFFSFKNFLPLLISGVALGVNWIFFFSAFNYADVATVVSIYYVGPIISLMLAGMFLKEKITLRIVFCACLAFLGVIVANGGFDLNKGTLIALLAAFSYGMLGFFSKLATLKHKPSVVTAWQILISVFITAPFLYFSDWQLTYQGLIISVITGVVHTALALFLWYDALNYIKVSLASVLQYLDIVFAMILAFVFLGEIPSLNQIIGAGLISAAGILSLRG